MSPVEAMFIVVVMRLSAYFGKRLHGMLSWTHVHV